MGTAGTIRAAITKFAKPVEASWKANGSRFATRYPDYQLFDELFARELIRVGTDGQLLFEPAFVLNLLRRIEKLEAREKELREAIADIVAALDGADLLAALETGQNEPEEADETEE